MENEVYTKGGITRTLIETGDNYRIWEGSLQGKTISFEVHQRRWQSSFVISGTRVAEREATPSDSSFGSWAWCYGADGYRQAKEKGLTLPAHKSMTDRWEKA